MHLFKNGTCLKRLPDCLEMYNPSSLHMILMLNNCYPEGIEENIVVILHISLI